ncbi:MAG: bifunctional DNA primase/polymerase [Anaerolineae bacterium]|nr:bifunctional DNA primase/polymerase [Anaerolineae bacterium]
MSRVILPWERKTGGNHRLNVALRYAAMGWHVFPAHSITEKGFCSCGKPDCSRQGKHPRVNSGLNDATIDPSMIRHWWRDWPDANVAVRTGRVSGIFVIDVDNHVYHDGKNGEEALQLLEDKHGTLPDTVEAMTGGAGGRHLFFNYPDNLDGGIKSRTHSLGDGIDVRGDGGYVIVYPSEGLRGTYEWEGSSDPLEGVISAPAPQWLIDMVTSEIRHHDGGDYTGSGTGFLHENVAAELRDALQHINPDESYDIWIGAAMALKSTDAGETAFAIWDEWSGRGAKYQPGEMAYKWRSLSVDGGLNKESIFYWALQRGWVNTMTVTPHQHMPVAAPSPLWVPPTADGDHRLFELPGRLGDLAKWANGNARRPQPHLTVNAILAGMSAIMGRRYRTTSGNWPALYFLNVAKSSSGKEHGKAIAEEMLDAAGLGCRIGGSGYTSAGAVFSQLEARPAHFAVIDEMGKALGSAQAKGNQHKLDAMTTLMEAWGRTDGIMRPPAYSTMSLRKTAATELQDRKVCNPSITLLGLSTPSTFYQSLSGAWVEDGFLSRLLVVESPIGRQVATLKEQAPISSDLADWLMAIGHPVHGNLAGIVDAADMPPTSRLISFSSGALRLFDAYERENNELMDSLESEGLDVLPGRDVEKAMKISLLVAAAPNMTVIDDRAATWAIDYVKYCTQQTLKAVREHLHEGDFSAIKQHLIDVVRKGGAKGRTVRELSMYSRRFKALKPREQTEVLEGIRLDGLAELQTVKSTSGRGRDRAAWVAINPETEDNADKPQTDLSAVITRTVDAQID